MNHSQPSAAPEQVLPASEEYRSLAVLIPVYNSERTIAPLVDRVLEVLEPHFDRVEVILVNDGSEDRSHARAIEAEGKHPGKVKYACLARNFGEHNAVMCGLHFVTASCVAIIDDDFQNPPEEILGLVEELRDGHDVVYSYYEKKKHNLFRNLGSAFNDRVAARVLNKPRGLYLSSFKVLNAFLVRQVITYEGPYPYLDALVLQATNRIGRRLCAHDDRREGRSNYNLRRLVRLWMNMFTSFSIVPLRMATILGFVMSGAGFLLALYFVIARFTGAFFFAQDIPPGWASIIVCLTVFSGLQLCVLGVIGEYLGRLFLTENRRPQFVVRETYGTAQRDIADSPPVRSGA